ncbi:MFS transporter [Streptomyces aureus]|uniref:MFS transporter n=1 Tax=Streptomyces aureus TaxID=193461 RepID=A0ABV4SSJ9_9ACTN
MTAAGKADGGPTSRTTSPPAPAKVTAVVGLLVAFELVSGLLQGAAPPLIPEVEKWQHLSTAQAQWFTTVQFLAAAVSVPAFGRLGDLYGHRRFIRVALGCVAVGTVLVTLAPNLTVLLLGRALMGPLAALLPLEIGLVRDRLDVGGRRRAVGLLVGSLTLGSLLGHALVGPLLSAVGGLRPTLAVLAALAVGCLVVSFLAVPESATRATGRMDWVGAVLLAIALVTLLGTISRGTAWGWLSPRTLGAAALSCAVLWWWARVQLSRPHALVDLRAVARRRAAPHYASGFALGAVMMGGQGVAVSYLAASPGDGGYGFGLATWQISVWGAIPHVMAFLGSVLCAGVAARFGYARTLLGAFALIAVGNAGLMAAHSTLPLFVVAYGVVGIGMGLALGGLPSVVVEGTAPDRTASAAAVYNNLKTLGGSVAGAVFAAVLGTLVVGTTDTPALSAYLTVWGLGLGVSVLAAGAQLLARLGAGRRAGTLAKAGTAIN